MCELFRFTLGDTLREASQQLASVFTAASSSALNSFREGSGRGHCSLFVAGWLTGVLGTLTEEVKKKYKERESKNWNDFLHSSAQQLTVMTRLQRVTEPDHERGPVLNPSTERFGIPCRL